MSVDIQRDAHIRVPHEVLQGFDVHARICHVGAEGVAEHMGRDAGQRPIGMEFLVLLHGPTHLVFDVQSHLGLVILVQQDKSAITVHDDFTFDLLAMCEDIFQAFVNELRHGNEAATALGFCFLNVILAAALPD